MSEDIGPNQFVKYLEYEGQRVASYVDEKYVLTGDYTTFVKDEMTAQDAFLNAPLGRY